MNALFSIIVPSYNRQQDILQLLVSLNQQTIKNFEVIVVDDCSPIPIQIEQEFSFPLRIIRNQKNSGPAISRNVGAQHALNEWLLFLDDDDRFVDNKCQLLTELITPNSTCNFIYHPAECLMVNQGFTYFTHPYSDPKMLTLDNLLGGNKLGGMPMIAIKNAFFQQLGGLSDKLRSLEDYDFVLKLVSNPEFSPAYLDNALTKCTFHTKRASVSTDTTNTELAIEQIREQYVKTPQQQQKFNVNALYMLAYPNIMNLSRKAAKYYWQMFKLSHSAKHLMMAVATFISPSLAINLKRFI